MAILRQLPGLYLRGSIANVTLINLTDEQKAQVERIVAIVYNHPEMAKHKAKFIKELSRTIKGDYADDRACAEQDYMISIWRAAASLIAHRDYEFFCTHCKAYTYTTKRGKPKGIDRIQVPCPSCRHAVVSNPGDSDLSIGDVVDHDIAQATFKSLKKAPTFQSTIKAVAGNMKYADPEAIINCPIQLKKFFGEFIWNYFRQQIKENKRKEHRKKPEKVSGPADKMTVDSIRNLLLNFKIPTNRYQILPQQGYYSISCNTLLTSPEFSIELAVIISAAEQSGVKVNILPNSINVQEVHDAEIVTITVTNPEHVTMLEQPASNDSDSGVYSIDQVSYKTVRGTRMDFDDHITTTDLFEASARIRNSLPEGDCRKVFDILRQMGDPYQEFAEAFGKAEPKINHIAEFLGITTRAVKQHKDAIRVNCLANGLMPETV